MNKIFLLLLFALNSIPVFCAVNNIKMVTYFPVPYVSYNQVDVSKALDVGVMKCDLALGCATGKPALNVYWDKNAGNDMVKKGYLRVTSGRLDLDSSSSVGKAISTKMFVGGNTTDTTLIGSTGEMSFEQNLRITKQTNRGQSLQATTESNTLTALKLFPANIKNNFPDCTGAEGAPDVSWQTLEVGNEGENVFMVCGKGKEGPEKPEKDCFDEGYKADHKSECCPTAVKTDRVCYKYVWFMDASTGLTNFEENCSQIFAYHLALAPQIPSCGTAPYFGASCQAWIDAGGAENVLGGCLWVQDNTPPVSPPYICNIMSGRCLLEKNGW